MLKTIDIAKAKLLNKYVGFTVNISTVGPVNRAMFQITGKLGFIDEFWYVESVQDTYCSVTFYITDIVNITEGNNTLAIMVR